MRNFLLIGILGVLIFSCTDLVEDDFLPLPAFTSNSISLEDIDEFDCSVKGKVTNLGDGVVEYGFVWSLGNANPTIEIRDGIDSIKTQSTDTVTINFESTLRLANVDLPYFVSAYAKDVHGRVFENKDSNGQFVDNFPVKGEFNRNICDQRELHNCRDTISN